MLPKYSTLASKIRALEIRFLQVRFICAQSSSHFTEYA